MRELLTTLAFLLNRTGPDEILSQIAIDRGDLQTATAYLNGIQVEPEMLLAAAELFRQGAPADLLSVYPNLIEALLRESLPRYWRAALQNLATYKKLCQQWQRRDYWKNLRHQLLLSYGEKVDFNRKFGTLLARLNKSIHAKN